VRAQLEKEEYLRQLAQKARGSRTKVAATDKGEEARERDQLRYERHIARAAPDKRSMLQHERLVSIRNEYIVFVVKLF
jgi:hypothetical protein